MIKKELKRQPDGTYKTFIRVVESYRPGPRMNAKQRPIRPFGYLEDQEDPDAFMAEVEAFNATFKDDFPLRIEVAQNALMYSENNRRLNYGYKYLEAVYGLLDIDGFIKGYEKKHGFKGGYSPGDIFKFLVLLRALSPDSKRATCQMKDDYYGMRTDFMLEDVYRSLDHYDAFFTELQRHLNGKVKETIGRDLSYAFYDVTNYFFEIDFNDPEGGLRHKGVSKEHRVSPIVSMGLFMDGNGLPVSMSVFPGNKSESLTLEPTMGDVKESYGLGRLIVVADKGLNTSKNINLVVNNGDGFVFSQILKGTKGKRYHEKLFDGSGWTANEKGTYRHKLFEETYVGYDRDGRKVERKRNVLIYWDKKDADMAARKREDKLKKAERSVKNNAYGIKKGQDEFIKTEPVDLSTGEYYENVKMVRSVDAEKATEAAKFDGYFCIITSETDYDERKIRSVYGGLWKIEQSFRIMKSDLDARPVYVWKEEHIRAHFLICFVALLLVRIIQHKMEGRALSAERVARALNSATCRVLKGGIIHLDDVGGAIAFQKALDKNGKIVDTLAYSSEDEIALDYRAIQATFGTGFYTIYSKQEVFNKFLKGLSVTLQKSHR
jgi:hypothetical protein